MTTSAFRVTRGLKRRGEGLPTHSHVEAQLTFALSGVVQVHTAAGRWLVPPRLAFWVPAKLSHWVEVLTDAELWIVHCDTKAVAEVGSLVGPDRAFAVGVTPLLRALLDAAFQKGVDANKSDLLIRLMLLELAETVDAPTYLPMPTTAAARRIANLAIDDPKGGLNLEALASRAGASVRTASRLFPAETGLTFKTWRQRARIVHAIDQLGRGRSIAYVASACGFSSAAAFSAAFRQVTRMTPTQFMNNRPPI
jgi:AraC-like DNA-binding protein